MQNLTWDISILLGLGILVAYSVFIRRHKSLATLVSVYVAYFVATAWGDKIAGFFSGEQILFNNLWIQANVTPFAVEIAVLILFTVLLSTFLKLGGRRSRYALVEVISYAICTVALLLLFILLLMPPDQRDGILAISKIAPVIFEWREWVVVLPIFIMVYFGIVNDDD